jgi:hypothetical protein
MCCSSTRVPRPRTAPPHRLAILEILAILKSVGARAGFHLPGRHQKTNQAVAGEWFHVLLFHACPTTLGLPHLMTSQFWKSIGARAGFHLPGGHQKNKSGSRRGVVICVPLPRVSRDPRTATPYHLAILEILAILKSIGARAGLPPAGRPSTNTNPNGGSGSM